MGQIDEYTRRVYAEILMGFIRKDYRRVAEVHFEAGYVPADRDIDEFARALRSVGEPIFGMDATRISMAKLLELPLRGHRTLRHADADRTDPAAAHHGRGRGGVALAQPVDQHLEGRPPGGRGLYPAAIWGPPRFARDLARTAQVLARFGPHLPGAVEAALVRARDRREPPREITIRTAPVLWFAAGAVVTAAFAALLAALL
jgi:ubiquinone biosynthesis protein